MKDYKFEFSIKDNIMGDISELIKSHTINYKDYTVIVSGYQTYIINVHDKDKLKELQKIYTNVRLVSDFEYCFVHSIPHGAIDVGGCNVMQVYSKIKFRNKAFNEYMNMANTVIYILWNRPSDIVELKSEPYCSRCHKRIINYYILMPQCICMRCVHLYLIPINILYKIPSYKHALPYLKIVDDITFHEDVAIIISKDYTKIGIINYIIQHYETLCDVQNIYVYTSRVYTYYLQDLEKLNTTTYT